MRIESFVPKRDCTVIENWITEERTHALWCAGRFPYPLEKDSFEDTLARLPVQPFIAMDDTGRVLGFFCFSLHEETREGVLKFVVIDPKERGKGLGKEMLRLALRHAFETTDAESVALSVFTENPAAKKCYLGIGFRERKTEPGAFSFQGEAWGRCSMVIQRYEFTDN